jgi:carbamoyltransferase
VGNYQNVLFKPGGFPMIVLGLNFGHDASVCVTRNGKILSIIERERISRVKHAATLDYLTVESALSTAGIEIKDVDYCAVTSTQGLEMISLDPEKLNLVYDLHEGHTAPSPLYDAAHSEGVTPMASGKPIINHFYKIDGPGKAWVSPLCPELKKINLSDIAWAPHIDKFSTCDEWSGKESLGLDWIRNFPVKKLLSMPEMRHAFHYPITVLINGIKLPAYYIYHHMAHAASAYYPVSREKVPMAVLCHDGGRDLGAEYSSGMVFLGDRNKLLPILPPNLRLGSLYKAVGKTLSFSHMAAPGKLMGLTSYGKPHFFDHRYVGNFADLQQQHKGAFIPFWHEHCIKLARAMNYDFSNFRNPEKITEPINADIAASTQQLFEETILAVTNTIFDMFINADMKISDLCYAGGIALNCPANTRIYNDGRFKHLHIPPWCNDVGLATGAALCVYHNVFDNPLSEDKPVGFNPYMGVESSKQEAERVLQEYVDKLYWEYPSDPAKEAAEMIADNKVIGWMEGRSEVGPRALGHRSIFANAMIGDNWQRVNKIKSRESWRPFAPMVTEKDHAEWFKDGPVKSPHMLFTLKVKGEKLPAITHVDGTARVQTVCAEDGQFHEILVYLKEMTGIPVMMNTSFNGPGEPIVDLPEHAILFFLDSGLDAIFINGIKIKKI